MEQRAIPGFEGLYEATRDGRIWSCKSKKFLKPVEISKTSRYLRVYLRKDGKTHPLLVHKLVALTFIPNPLNLDTVDHKDFDIHNNSVDNLRWMSRSENSGRRRNTNQEEL